MVLHAVLHQLLLVQVPGAAVRAHKRRAIGNIAKESGGELRSPGKRPDRLLPTQPSRPCSHFVPPRPARSHPGLGGRLGQSFLPHHAARHRAARGLRALGGGKVLRFLPVIAQGKGKDALGFEGSPGSGAQSARRTFSSRTRGGGTWGWAGTWGRRERTWGSSPSAPAPSRRTRRESAFWPGSPGGEGEKKQRGEERRTVRQRGT